jgi:hypothetical protein
LRGETNHDVTQQIFQNSIEMFHIK